MLNIHKAMNYNQPIQFRSYEMKTYFSYNITNGHYGYIKTIPAMSWTKRGVFFGGNLSAERVLVTRLGSHYKVADLDLTTMVIWIAFHLFDGYSLIKNFTVIFMVNLKKYLGNPVHCNVKIEICTIYIYIFSSGNCKIKCT